MKRLAFSAEITKYTPNNSYIINNDSLKNILNIEVMNCFYRGLDESSLWLMELLSSIYPDLEEMEEDFTPTLGLYYKKYYFCKSLFNKGDFNRCSFHLREHIGKNNIIDFLYFYARFKVNLKYLYESEVDWMTNESQRYVDGLVELKEDLEDHLQEHSEDAYLFYLLGMVLKKLDLNKEARSKLLRALDINCYLWSAWYELTDIVECNDRDLPQNWMKTFFDVKSLKLLNNKDACDETINNLIKNGYDKFDDLKIDLAIANEQKNNSVYALELFNEIYERDPYRMDYFATFSNILFLQENHTMLALLTQNCVKNDRYRPETCCVVGNFYSLRNQHEKAAMYFQRALKLNPAQSSVWLLAAHEYLEMSNYNAAVQCYCKAIEYNSKSYRAWYGLGQLYEIFTNYKFALTCFQNGFELMPSDSRILVGLGSIYEQLGRHEEAKSCYNRAHDIGDIEHIALVKLGKLLEKMKEMKEAAMIFNLFIDEVQEEGFSALENVSYANVFLANYHWKYSTNLDKARHFASKCCEISDSKMVGEDLLRKIAAVDKGDAYDKDITTPFYGLESAVMYKMPSDDNLASNAMNLSLGDNSSENDNEVME